MSYTKINLTELHLEHELWSKELGYWRDEIKVLEKYLTGLDYKKIPNEAGAEVEHFQNQFIRNKNVVHDLKHEVDNHEQLLRDVEKVEDNEELQDKFLDIHSDLREKINTGRKIYSELKEEFRVWLAKRV
jgi:DNA-binding transcriptional regulator GbsR (MarR family)